jgi:hypothetical protein
VLGHRVEALRLTPEGLNDGMNVRRKLPDFAHKPLERSRGRWTKDPHEPAWCGRCPSTQESETCPDDANVREHGAYAGQVSPAPQHAGTLGSHRHPFSGWVDQDKSTNVTGMAGGVRANHETTERMADKHESVCRGDARKHH